MMWVREAAAWWLELLLFCIAGLLLLLLSLQAIALVVDCWCRCRAACCGLHVQNKAIAQWSGCRCICTFDGWINKGTGFVSAWF
jgi:hypothetical protein